MPAFGYTDNTVFLTDRQRLFSALFAEARACGLQQYRVGYPKGGKAMDWRFEVPEIGGHTYGYRTVLPNQIVFDVGDHGDWDRCARDTHAIWSALNFLGLRYWGSLSGGKGTHTELFGPTRLGKAEREAIARYILAVASRFLHGHGWGSSPSTDPVLVAPSANSRMLREFGSPKVAGAAETKVLWTMGPSQFTPLPATRAAAYQKARALALGMPIAIPRNDDLQRLLFFEDSKAIGHPVCPQGPGCIPGPGNESMWGTCEDCPRLD